MCKAATLFQSENTQRMTNQDQVVWLKKRLIQVAAGAVKVCFLRHNSAATRHNAAFNFCEQPIGKMGKGTSANHAPE